MKIEKIQKDRPCAFCGKIMINPHPHAKYHKECYIALDRQRQREYRARCKENQKNNIKNEILHKRTLDDCAKEATKLGISYGTYMIDHFHR